MTNYGLKQNLGNGKCYMENGDEGYFKRVEGDSYCPDYLNRVRGNKTKNMTLEEWIKKKITSQWRNIYDKRRTKNKSI
jgi:hypothetical protein